MTVKQITSDFADRVSGDGFSDIKRARSIPAKIFWIILFILAWIIITYQVISYVSKYLKYPVETQVELKFDDSAAAPAVTFCNLNPVRSSEATVFDADVRDVVAQEVKFLVRHLGTECELW